jgi:iron complex transport system ATP-binding protein
VKIKIQDIEFRYNGTPVLKNVTGHVNRGEFLALVGPNGSGKSTLIKCLNGILKPKLGAVLIDDKAIQSYSSKGLAREMAYVPQNEMKKFTATVFDTVLLGRKPYINWKPSPKDLDITARVLKTLHLEDIAMKDINKLSGGQQQTVYIARALAQEPEVLLLDEPTANLDIRHQVEVLEWLKKLSREGMTVVIALHDINMAIRYADSIIMLKDGKIFSHGGMETVTVENIEYLYDINVHLVRENGRVFILPGGLP